MFFIRDLMYTVFEVGDDVFVSGPALLGLSQHCHSTMKGNSKWFCHKWEAWRRFTVIRFAEIDKFENILGGCLLRRIRYMYND